MSSIKQEILLVFIRAHHKNMMVVVVDETIFCLTRAVIFSSLSFETRGQCV